MVCLLRIILWGCAKHIWTDIEHDIRKQASVVEASSHLHIHKFDEFVREIYKIDNIAADLVALKVRHLSECAPEILTLTIAADDPRYRMKNSGSLISRVMEMLKKRIRTEYKGRVPNYLHDIIIHGADNEKHTRHIDRLLGQVWIDGEQCTESNRWACAVGVMRQHNASDWMVVGSTPIAEVAGFTANDLDLVVGESERRIFRASPRSATTIAHKIMIKSRNWLSPVVSDSLLMQDAQWCSHTRGQLRVSYARMEAVIIKKLLTTRNNDIRHLTALCARPFAYDRSVFLRAESLLRNRGAARRPLSGDPCPSFVSPDCSMHDECNACVDKPKCAFCAAGDYRGCFDATSDPTYCERMSKVNVVTTRKSKCRNEACADTDIKPCSFPSGNERFCCTIDTCRLLRLQTSNDVFARFDIVLRALVAEAWQRNASRDELYTMHLKHRVQQDAQIRLDGFKTLFRSVTKMGFMWAKHPIPVSSDGHMYEGSHRMALALLFSEKKLIVFVKAKRGIQPQSSSYIARTIKYRLNHTYLQTRFHLFSSALGCEM